MIQDFSEQPIETAVCPHNFAMNDLAPTFSKIEDSWFDGYTTSWLGYSAGTNQNDYLRFAEDDLNDGKSDRHLINAVSNAKRALHIEVETLSNAYGISAATKKIGSFPQRLAFLSKAGFFTKPRLLTKLNKLRNIVEHEYHVPTLEEAENFVDIVELFVNAMQKHRQRYPDEIEMCQAFDDTGNWHIRRTYCNLARGELKLQILPVDMYQSSSPNQFKFVRISEDPDEYLRWLSCIVGQNS